MTKHVGVLSNTGKNVVVVFMSLPDDNEHALVVDTDALPDSLNESLRKIVESVDGQQAKDLADILARRPSPDGSGPLLNKLHSSGRLMRVPIDLVTMTPRRGVNWPLKDILAAMKSEKDQAPVSFDDLDPETRAEIASEIGKFNVHAKNLEGETAAGVKAEAANLIRMAEILESDAIAKRQQAYKLDPSLKRANKAATVSDLSTTEAVKVAKAEPKKVAEKKVATPKTVAKTTKKS